AHGELGAARAGGPCGADAPLVTRAALGAAACRGALLLRPETRGLRSLALLVRLEVGGFGGGEPVRPPLHAGRALPDRVLADERRHREGDGPVGLGATQRGDRARSDETWSTAAGVRGRRVLEPQAGVRAPSPGRAAPQPHDDDVAAPPRALDRERGRCLQATL